MDLISVYSMLYVTAYPSLCSLCWFSLSLPRSACVWLAWSARGRAVDLRPLVVLASAATPGAALAPLLAMSADTLAAAGHPKPEAVEVRLARPATESRLLQLQLIAR